MLLDMHDNTYHQHGLLRQNFIFSIMKSLLFHDSLLAYQYVIEKNIAKLQ